MKRIPAERATDASIIILFRNHCNPWRKDYRPDVKNRFTTAQRGSFSLSSAARIVSFSHL